MLTGNYPVKLEFSDDSFALANAELLPAGKVVINIGTVPTEKNFKLVLVSDSDELHEFRCLIDSVDGDKLRGRLSAFDN